MKKRIKIIKENLVKLLTGTIALVSATIAVTLSTACTEEEMNQAIDALNQISTEQETPEQTTEVVEIPIEEPEVEEPIEEPEVEEVEEINPRDMKAVYGLDFDVPIYTEEEVEEAKKYLEENEEDIPYLEKCIIPDTDIESYRNVINEDKIEDVCHYYYIVNQDNIYKAYSQFIGLDAEALINNHITGFIDEENNAFAKIDSDKEANSCRINYYNKDTKIGMQIDINDDYLLSEDSIGKLLRVKYVPVAPNAVVSVIHPNYFDIECRHDEEQINKIPEVFIATPDTIDNYKTKSTNINKSMSLKMD